MIKTMKKTLNFDLNAGMDFRFDLNAPAQEEEAIQQPMEDVARDSNQGTEDPTASMNKLGPSIESVGIFIGDTLSSDDSGGEDEVQSTPSLTPIEKPHPDMLFDSWEDAKFFYNRYAKHVGFSIKASTSRCSTVDKQKDKCLFVCNKSGKNDDINKQEVPPMRQRIRAITKKTDCKARLRVKRRGAKWRVTMLIEDHNHPCIKKFSLKSFLRSHKGIPKEEREFVKLLHKMNLSAGRVMSIMAELYGNLGNVPFDRKDITNFMATLDSAAQNNQDMSLLLAEMEKLKKDDPQFICKLDVDNDKRVK
jgi:hypothetical protein